MPARSVILSDRHAGFGVLHVPLVAMLAVLLLLTAVPVAWATPTLTAGGPFAYTEQDPPTNIGTGLSLAGGSSYDGQYVEFGVDAATADEHLTLSEDGSPATGDGEVSVVGGTVYLGDGSAASPIGSVDPTQDGRDGRPLRVNFSSPFTNPGFEAGELGWTALERRIDLGVDTIAGHATVDTSTYPSGSHPTRGSSWTPPNQDDDAPAYASFAVQTTTSGEPTEGSSALQLQSSMTTAGGCDVVHGPAVHSSAFEAAAGDTIYFDWRAYAGSDAYHVFGYIVDDHGNQTEVLDAFTWDAGGSTDWATKETVIPTTGNYRFVFVAGTFDATCGLAAGARLLIDNVRVYGNKVTDDVVEAIGWKLQYENTSDDPDTTRTVGVTAVDADGAVGTTDITVNVTPVDDPPTLAAPADVVFTNTEGGDDFDTTFATLTATDPDSSTFAYDLDGATGTDWHTVAGTYATVRVHTSGAMTVEARDAAVEARLTPDTETFTTRVTADGAADTQTLTVRVAIDPSAPGAPQDVQATAGDSQATVSWTPGTWIGGSEVTGHVVQASSDGGATWSTVATVGAVTETTVTGLTPGTTYTFRVAATNASGTSGFSGASNAVTPQTTQDTLTLLADDVTYGDTATLDVDGGSGTGEVTYKVVSGPCTVDGTTLATTGVGTCELQAAKAGDTTYYPTDTDLQVTVLPRALTVAGAQVAERAYDGTDAAAITGAALAGLVPGDDVALADHTTGTFGQTTVGEDLAVAVAMALTGDDAVNYTLTQPTLTGSILPRSLHVVGAAAQPKVYDGTADAMVTGATLFAAVPGDDVALTGHTTGTFTQAQAGDDITVTTAMSLVGSDASNYVVTQPALTADIGERVLHVTGATVASRAYDGTTSAVVRGARLDGVLEGDDVSLVDGGRGTFATASAGTRVAVTTGISLVGDDASSYTVLQPTLAGTITSRELTVIGARVAPKVVDGTTTATIVGARLHGAIDGDDVTLDGLASAAFARADVGEDVPVTVELALSGEDAAEYTLAAPTGLHGAITAAPSMSFGQAGDDILDPDDRDVPTRHVAGETVSTQLCNLSPGTTVEVRLGDDLIDTVPVDEDGCALVTAVLSADLAAGRHLLTYHGTDLTGGPVTLTHEVEIEAATPPSRPAALPATGASIAALLLLATLALGAGMPMTRRCPQ